MTIDRYTTGAVYLLHFARPLGNLDNPRGQAGHYLGWALNPQFRIDQHLAGLSGVSIVLAALKAGIELRPYILGRAPKDAEYYIKTHVKNTRQFCPECMRAVGKRPRPLPYSSDQLLLDLDEPMPDAPSGLAFDRYEYLVSRSWRQARALGKPAIDLATLDDLL